MKQVKKIFLYIKKIFYYFFIRQRRYRQRLYLRLKIKKLIANNRLLKNRKNEDKQYLKEAEKFLNTLRSGYKNTNWHYAYSTLNGMKSVEYIPEELFFPYIEPALNNKTLKNAYTDKTAYSHFFDKKYLPETVFKIINGNFYTDDFTFVEKEIALSAIQKIKENLIVKPAIFTGGGKNIIIANSSEVAAKLKDKSFYKNDSFIIQKFAKQHEFMNRVNPTSLNTMRILTARVKNDVIVVSVYFRMGKKGVQIDNIVAGGVLCGVSENGRLHKTGYDIRFNKYEKHPDSGIVFHNLEIPGYKKACDFCKSHHKKFPHFTFISWDIGVSPKTEPIFIELNLSSQEIGCHQIINGPLFGKHLNYFIEQYKNSNLIDQFRLNL